MTTIKQPFSRYKPIIDDWEAFQDFIKRPLSTTIWANPLKTTPEKLSQLLTESNIPHEPISWHQGGFRLPSEFKPGLRWEYLAGLYHVQEEVSMLPVRFMQIQPGERVLDMCAAPGNKTAQIAIALNNRGTVVANDRNPGRMRAARQTFNRLGLVNISTTVTDGSNYSKHAGLFDKVLVDAPCSCEGTCRKSPSSPIRPIKSSKLVGTQRALLRKGIQLCKPGGRIVYATCTFAPEENEMVVDALLRELGDGVRLLPVQPPPEFTTSSGLTSWGDDKFDPSLKNALRIWPHQNDTGGFFVAVLEKVGQKETAVSTNEPPFDVEQEREPWLTILADRFDLNPALFEDAHIFRGSKKKIYLVNDDHQPPQKPVPDAVGIHFMRVDGRFPKLTTGAAMLFAPHATRNIVELTAQQMVDFIARRELTLPAAQLQNCTGNGYVMLRFAGSWLGQGTLYMDKDGSGGGRVESLFPKAWSRNLPHLR